MTTEARLSGIQPQSRFRLSHERDFFSPRVMLKWTGRGVRTACRRRPGAG